MARLHAWFLFADRRDDLGDYGHEIVPTFLYRGAGIGWIAEFGGVCSVADFGGE